MNSIHGIIHDLADEETVIGGCTTAGEVIIALQSLVEQNNLLKEKLAKMDIAIEEIEKRSFDNEPFIIGECLKTYRNEVLKILKNIGE